MGLMGDKNNWRRVRHQKGAKVGIETGEMTPGDLQEGEEKIVKLSSGQLVKYLKFNGVLRTMPIDPLPDSNNTGDYLYDNINGFAVLADGLILQWGRVTANATTKTVTFLRAFPNACLNVVCTDYDNGDNTGMTSATGISTLATKTTVVFSCYNSVDYFFWQAIGH